MFDTGNLWATLFTHLATGILGAIISQAWTARLLHVHGRVNGKWADVASLAITKAPELLEGATRATVGVQEILHLIIRAGGIGQLIRASTRATQQAAKPAKKE